MTNIENKKVVLVTGASRGIGNAIAKEFAKNPDNIIVGTATTDERAADFVEIMKAEGIKNVFGLGMDIGNPESITDGVKRVIDEFGAPNILINNAGTTADNLFMLMKDKDWDKIIDVNLGGVFRVRKACIRAMVKARWGRIINISSIVGTTGNPGQSNYSAAKAGVVAMTKSLASEIASRNITVNAIAPGFIETDMTNKLNEKQTDGILSTIPMARMGLPKDIANAAIFLASDAASYITGETIHVNGGMYMS